MQILADMQTIEEKFGSLKGIRMAYLGDIRNNVTYGLMCGGALMGFTVAVAHGSTVTRPTGAPCRRAYAVPTCREARARSGDVRATCEASHGPHVLLARSRAPC